jgi:hypothetical protein
MANEGLAATGGLVDSDALNAQIASLQEDP